MKRSIRIALGVSIALAIVFCFRGGDQENSYLYEKASTLEFSQEQIVTFVHEEISPLPGSEAFRGALGTLWEGAGSRKESAHLLSELLGHSGIENSVVSNGEQFGVRVASSGEVIPAVNGEALTSHEEIENYPNFSISMPVIGRETETVSFQGNTSEFLSSPLRIAITDGTATLVGPDDQTLLAAVFSPGERVLAKISFHLLDGSLETVTRELIDDTVPQPCMPAEHVIVFAPCEIDEGIFRKQKALIAQSWGESSPSYQSYSLVLDHWYQSDRMLTDLRTHFDADAFYRIPRVLIGSCYLDDSGDPAGYALDLRRNSIHLTHNDDKARSFALTRASLEAELEANVILSATGMSSRSAIEVFLAHLNHGAQQSGPRISGYERTFAGFLRDTFPGVKLHLRADEGRTVSLTHLPGSRGIGIEFSKSLQEALDSNDYFPWTHCKSGEILNGSFEEAAYELEALLGPVSGADLDYTTTSELEYCYDLIDTPYVREFHFWWVPGEEQFRTAAEEQITRISDDGSYVYERVAYTYEDETSITPGHVENTSYTVPAATRRSGKGCTLWHSQNNISNGANALSMSQDFLQDLKDDGYAEAIPYYWDGSPGAPLKLYAVTHAQFELSINRKKVSIPAIWVTGNYASGNKPKPERWGSRYLDDPSIPNVGNEKTTHDGYNTFVIADNANLPRVLNSRTEFQAPIHGRITSAENGASVENAEILVMDTQSKASTWPTGDFVLPLISKPHDVFTVKVTHPDYDTWSEAIDFRDRAGFERLKKITLTPRSSSIDSPQHKVANPFTWVTPETLEQDLRKLSSERTQRYIREALEDNPSLQALVPLEETSQELRMETAWLLFDRETNHFTAVTHDGLHGAVGTVSNVGSAAGDGAISAYSGFVSSWFAYSGGKIEAITEAMRGGDFSDLGHAHAKAFALNFLETMSDKTDNIFADQAGVNSAAYRAGFLQGLSFFDKHPGYRGE
ncbi:MAG: hypothetical protein P1U86_05625 [Verrucomicrobiales bacterium]|nr:hypothetical protein [Verrucomicrobiales bacterium]